MGSFKIISDSGAGLPPHLISQYPIKIVPLNVVIGRESYPDNQLTLTEFLNLQENSGQKITTSAPSPQSFMESFDQAKKERFKEILVISL